MERIMEGVTEYAEGFPVEISEYIPEGKRDARLVIKAINQGGYDSTAVDLLELIAWIKENRSDLL